MSEEEVKDSNELLNIILILLGGFYVFLAIVDFLTWAGFPLALPPEITGGAASSQLQAILGSQGLITITLGVFSIIAGIGMFREEEWALGIGLVVLAIISVNSVADLIGIIGAGGSWWLVWVNYITIVALIIGVVGFFWLVFTTERYK
ncbi:MAG: hypothetical protein GF311_07675 [Candidatus Lokiarchaeota archaeon]|nr:hypothetical protein [Candidatus Lokiarchaeota archaeon]